MIKDKMLFPQKRFSKFKDMWTIDILSNVTDVRDGTHDSPKYLSQGHPFITSKNVKDGFVDFNDIQYISKEDFADINKRSKVDVNDILMGMIGTVGNLALIRNEPNFAIKNVALIKNINKVDYNYLYNVLQSRNLKRQIFDGLDGGTQKFISLFKIRNLRIPLPHIKEQQKIGEFFKVLDNRIANQERKIAKVKALKEAYLTEMFPQEGEIIPKRRFKGFEGEWEKQSLGNITSVVMGHSPKSTSYTTDRKQHILVQGNADIEKYRVTPRIWTKEVTKMANKNDLIVTVRAPVGEIAKTDYDVVLGRGVAGLKGSEFIFQYLLKLKQENYWKSLSTGSTFDSITSDQLLDVEILLPSLQEQQKIGAFFKNLDDQIQAEESKLEKLKKMKEAYLEEMFV